MEWHKTVSSGLKDGRNESAEEAPFVALVHHVKLATKNNLLGHAQFMSTFHCGFDSTTYFKHVVDNQEEWVIQVPILYALAPGILDGGSTQLGGSWGLWVGEGENDKEGEPGSACLGGLE